METSVEHERAPRDRGAAESARFALLGLLLRKPAHGYDLARQFAPGSALGDVLYLSPSHLYALLARLERDELILGEMHDAGKHPQRRVYQLTAAGEAAVRRWIDEPVSHPRDMRIDFPVKLYVARASGGQKVAELIDRQRIVFESYIARLQRKEAAVESAEDAAFIDLMRMARIGRARAALDWLSLCAGSGSGR
jgi:DNA-binding PadR family transcriptional regulator